MTISLKMCFQHEVKLAAKILNLKKLLNHLEKSKRAFVCNSKEIIRNSCRVMAADGEEEEFFSADSLELAAVPNKTGKKTKFVPRRRSKQLTYLQIYRIRLLKDSQSCTIRPESECDAKSTENLNSSPEVPHEARHNRKIKKKSSHRTFHPEALHRSKSEVDQKIELLNKRLEYGKQTNTSNRFHLLRLKMKNDKGDKNSRSSSNFKETKRIEAEPNSSFAVDEIQLKLQQLKVRHQKDKKIVEKIRQSLKSVRVVDDCET